MVAGHAFRQHFMPRRRARQRLHLAYASSGLLIYRLVRQTKDICNEAGRAPIAVRRHREVRLWPFNQAMKTTPASALRGA